MTAALAFAAPANDHNAGCNAGDEVACLSGTRSAQRDGQRKLKMQFITKVYALGYNIARSNLGCFKLM